MNRVVTWAALLTLIFVSSSIAQTTKPADVIRVAIYSDGGAPEKGGKNVENCLAQLPGKYTVKFVNGADVRGGALADADVAVFPGGSGSKQAASLEEAGLEKVREFVKNGGGYVGICGGAYLGSADYKWSLNILNARVVDRAHWARGSGTVKLNLTSEGKTFLKESADQVDCRYNQGPLLAPTTRPGLPAYEPLATFGTEIAEKGAPTGVMIGTTAIARANFEKGRVILISPHPENSPGLDGFIRTVVDWTSGK